MQKYSAFPIINNVVVKINLIRVSSQTSTEQFQVDSADPKVGHVLICAWSSELWKGTGYAFPLLIPAALSVSAANQDAHKTQENYVFQLPQNPNYTPFSS